MREEWRRAPDAFRQLDDLHATTPVLADRAAGRAAAEPDDEGVDR